MTKTAVQKKPPEDEVEVFDVEQRSDSWFELRRGIPSASKFSSILAEGDGKMRAKYLDQLAGELISGNVAETFRSEAMDRGVEMEPSARDWYARTHFVDLTPVGFIKRTVRNPLGLEFSAGCSPDAKVTERKGLEIKTMAPDRFVAVSRRAAGGFPPEFRAQVQGTMWVAGWDEMDLVIFWDGRNGTMALEYTVTRDDQYIRELANAVEKFAWDLHKLIEQTKARLR